MFSEREIGVLHCLRKSSGAEPDATVEVTEIGLAIGLRDNDEVLRALYTLEGKHLVAPQPAGDLTSSRWRITPIGLKAIQVLGL